MAQPSLQPRPRRRRRWFWRGLLQFMLLVLALAAGAAGGFFAAASRRVPPIWDPLVFRGYFQRPLDTALPGEGFWITGYYVGYDRFSREAVQQRSPHLDQVLTFAHGFKADGSVTGEDPWAALGATHPAKITLLFANVDGEGGFSAALLKSILTDAGVRARAVAGIAGKARSLKSAGVQLDFEGVPPGLRPEFTALVRELKDILGPLGIRLSLAVPAKTHDNPGHGWSGAFDYPALGALVDQLFIMAYDQHYSGGPPGPVASLPWVDQVLRYAISVVPTSKLVLGVPGYGYDWTLGGSGRAFASPRMDARLRELKAQIRWDPVMAENVATYQDVAGGDHVAWYPDERSLTAKLELVRRYNLKGLALWRLGFETDDYWRIFAQARQP